MAVNFTDLSAHQSQVNKQHDGVMISFYLSHASQEFPVFLCVYCKYGFALFCVGRTVHLYLVKLVWFR